MEVQNIYALKNLKEEWGNMQIKNFYNFINFIK